MSQNSPFKNTQNQNKNENDISNENETPQNEISSTFLNGNQQRMSERSNGESFKSTVVFPRQPQRPQMPIDPILMTKHMFDTNGSIINNNTMTQLQKIFMEKPPEIQEIQEIQKEEEEAVIVEPSQIPLDEEESKENNETPFDVYQQPFVPSNKIQKSNIQWNKETETETIAIDTSHLLEYPNSQPICVEELLSPHTSYTSKLGCDDTLSRIYGYLLSLKSEYIKEITVSEMKWEIRFKIILNSTETEALLSFYKSYSPEKYKSVIELRRITGFGFGFYEFFIEFENYMFDSSNDLCYKANLFIEDNVGIREEMVMSETSNIEYTEEEFNEEEWDKEFADLNIEF